MLPAIGETFRGLDGWELNDDDQTLTLLPVSSGDDKKDDSNVNVSSGINTDTEVQCRSKVIERATLAMRETSHFEVLSKWRNELYPVYGPDDEGGSHLLFEIERSAAPLFGIVTYGVHMTGYVRPSSSLSTSPTSDDASIKVWVPRRAKEKQTYGGMLDNTVAGGISSGETPFTSLIREAAEEASIPDKLVRERAKPCGTVSYFTVRDERAGGETGLLQPEVQYVYDIELPADFTPKPSDGEVQDFDLWDVEEIRDAMAAGEFKPNCALVMMDFFVRHGILTPENEKDYLKIVPRLHRRLEFPIR